ncbi:hypothetical protein TURU_013218 [Turdus rufiventris]|nr:hypothetical protein TURU_013218 [Turdus rufiventris]
MRQILNLLFKHSGLIEATGKFSSQKVGQDIWKAEDLNKKLQQAAFKWSRNMKKNKCLFNALLRQVYGVNFIVFHISGGIKTTDEYENINRMQQLFFQQKLWMKGNFLNPKTSSQFFDNGIYIWGAWAWTQLSRCDSPVQSAEAGSPPLAAGLTFTNAPQDAIDLLGPQGTLLAHGQPSVHQNIF